MERWPIGQPPQKKGNPKIATTGDAWYVGDHASKILSSVFESATASQLCEICQPLSVWCHTSDGSYICLSHDPFLSVCYTVAWSCLSTLVPGSVLRF